MQTQELIGNQASDNLCQAYHGIIHPGVGRKWNSLFKPANTVGHDCDRVKKTENESKVVAVYCASRVLAWLHIFCKVRKLVAGRSLLLRFDFMQFQLLSDLTAITETNNQQQCIPRGRKIRTPNITPFAAH